MKLRNYLDILEDLNIVKILRWLCLEGNGGSGREIGIRTGIPQATCNRYLVKLLAHGLISFQNYGSANIYFLKECFYINEVLRPLFRNEMNMFLEHIVADLNREYSKYCKGIILFGSYARNEETDDSDLDFCFVVKEGHKENLVEALVDEAILFERKYLVTLAPIILTVSEFKKEKRRAVVKQIIEEGSWTYGSLGEVLYK